MHIYISHFLYVGTVVRVYACTHMAFFSLDFHLPISPIISHGMHTQCKPWTIFPWLYSSFGSKISMSPHSMHTYRLYKCRRGTSFHDCTEVSVRIFPWALTACIHRDYIKHHLSGLCFIFELQFLMCACSMRTRTYTEYTKNIHR